MKKFGLLVLGIIAGIVALANLGSLLGLGVSALIVFAGIHFYLKSESTFLNVPGFFGILAIVGVWYVVKKWNNEPVSFSKSAVKSDDPFVNFEKQWNELSK